MWFLLRKQNSLKKEPDDVIYENCTVPKHVSLKSRKKDNLLHFRPLKMSNHIPLTIKSIYYSSLKATAVQSELKQKKKHLILQK